VLLGVGKLTASWTLSLITESGGGEEGTMGTRKSGSGKKDFDRGLASGPAGLTCTSAEKGEEKWGETVERGGLEG